MANTFLSILCLPYRALFGLFAARLTPSKVSHLSKAELISLGLTLSEFARHDPPISWMHRGRPGLRSGISPSRNSRSH